MVELNLSVAVLAGGKSERMGSDKAFLTYREKPFIRIITDEMLKISSDVVLVIGRKAASRFEGEVDPSVRIVHDVYNIQNPMGGILSACAHVKNKYSAFVGCDTPMIMSKVIKYLAEKAADCSAAVPRWENGDKEPLCAVYNVRETKEAGENVLRDGKIGCSHLLSFMKNVNYVDVEELRKFDPDLRSLTNINTAGDLQYLE